MTSSTYLTLGFILGIKFLEPYLVQAVIPIGQDFLVGKGYDEEFNIKKVKPKKAPRITIGSYRLPKSVIPIHYELQIRPILENGSKVELMTAPGKVSIHILAKESVNSITLHAKNLFIDNHQIVSPSGQEHLRVTGHNMDEERSFYVIYLDGDLKIGLEYILNIPFRAKISSGKILVAGLFTTSFIGSDGKQKTGVVTQFQKDEASRAFPCFDEPQLKAEFSIKIGRLAEKYTSFCNMPRLGEPTPIDGLHGWVWDVYEKSLKFPTYLIEIAVLPDYVAVETPSDLYRNPVKTWVPRSEKSNTSVAFSAVAAGKLLTYYENLFEVPFYLSKMDNLAVSDLKLQGMEHPGLVTYQTNILVWHEGRDTQFNLLDGAQLIAHEFAHQWFGNLVTCSWWNDFWLNEGFSRYFESMSADQSGINFRLKDRFVIDIVQWAMEFDESSDTVSLSNWDTNNVFYQPYHIEYEKGACIVRMMQTILTQDTFIKGLRIYFKRHAFGNAAQEDLYSAMDDAVKEDGTLTKFSVAEVMKPWVTKAGYPVIFVTRSDKDSIFISQQRFIVHPAANDKIEPGLWYVPIWFITKSQPQIDMDNSTPKHWLDQDTLTTYISMNRSDDWVIVNPEARGYYRVVYDRTLTSLIVKQLREDHTVFNFATRSQLFDDHFRCAHARYIGISKVFDLTAYLPKEDDLIVWLSVFNNLRKIYQRIGDTSLVEPFKKFIVGLIDPPFKRLGLHLPSTASPSDVMLHTLFIDWLCTLEDPLCEETVRRYMDKWLKEPNPNNNNCPIPADQFSIIFCAAVAHMPDKKAEEFFLHLYKTNKNPRYRKSLVRALTCHKNEAELKQLVENAINPDNPGIDTDEHGLLVLTSAIANPNGRNLIWGTVKNRSSFITEAMGEMAIPKVIEAIVPFLSNQGMSKLNFEIVDFIHEYIHRNKKTLGSKAHDSLQKSAQQVVDNSLWMDYFYKDIETWLNKDRD